MTELQGRNFLSRVNFYCFYGGFRLSSGCFASFWRLLSFSAVTLGLLRNFVSLTSHFHTNVQDPNEPRDAPSKQRALRQSREARHRLISLFRALLPLCHDVCGGRLRQRRRYRRLRLAAPKSQRHRLTFKKNAQTAAASQTLQRERRRRRPGAVAVDPYFFGGGGSLFRKQQLML